MWSDINRSHPFISCIHSLSGEHMMNLRLLSAVHSTAHITAWVLFKWEKCTGKRCYHLRHDTNPWETMGLISGHLSKAGDQTCKMKTDFSWKVVLQQHTMQSKRVETRCTTSRNPTCFLFPKMRNRTREREREREQQVGGVLLEDCIPKYVSLVGQQSQSSQEVLSTLAPLHTISTLLSI